MATDFSIRLDPAHPSLDDHRPGGDPLYGTAMSIDTLATLIANDLGLGQTEPVIAEVEVRHPWILKGDMEPIIRARLESQTVQDGRLTCWTSLFSNLSVGGEDLHLRCRLDFDEAPTPTPSHRAFTATWGADEVSADQIYSVFFHGPAFQLVAGVQASGDRVRSRMASSARTSRLPERARLIEFALQTAGLWELCSSGRMMIPHGIRRIVRHGPLLEDDGGSVFALARRGGGAGTADEIDIDVFDARGRTILSVDGYQTVALPFASDTTAALNLGQRIAQTVALAS